MTLFTNRAQAIARMRADRLMTVAANFFPGVEISDDFIWEKLMAEEVALEHECRTWFTPREVLPWSATDDEVAALPAGTQVEREAGYDYDPAMFQGNTWGLIQLRQKPASAVRRINFIYPNSSGYDIPLSWVRLDHKVGRINLIPNNGIQMLPLNAFLLSVVGGGRSIPQMLEIRYRAGLEDALNRWPDLVDLIRKSATLSLIEDQYLPGSDSTSADGLSQSFSFESKAHAERLEARTKTIRSVLRGITMIVA